MDARLLQDFLTVRGTSATNPATQIIQPSYGWLDLGDFEDIVLYCDVRETTPTAQLTYETAPAANDSAFVPLIPLFTMSVGLTTTNIPAFLAKVPPARFLRWRVTGDGTPFDVTFRIWLAAYGWA
jgi:hypothetical protein